MRFIALILALSWSFSLHAAWTRFEVRDAAMRDVVQFTSDAPLEKVVGTTNAVRGWLSLDPQKLKRGLKGEFEVDMRTFNTGMLLRNEHFRSKFLETAQYPFSKFVFTRLLSASKGRLSAGQPVVIKAQGDLQIKGRSQPTKVEMKLVYFKGTKKTRDRLDGNLLRIDARFSLDVTKFGVYWIPDLAMRLSKNVQVQVDALATDLAAPVIIPEPEPEDNERSIADATSTASSPKKRQTQRKTRRRKK